MNDYRDCARDARRGGLVLLGAIDGPKPYVRDLAEAFASEGYDVLAPALSAGRDPDPPADPSNLDVFERSGWGERCLPAVQAAIDSLEGPVFLIGFSFGGTLAWLAAARCHGLAAASIFYGGHVLHWIDEGLRCPVALHFGRRDPIVPEADVQRIMQARPDLAVWTYEAAHDFVAPGPDHAEEAARLALLRTRQLFHKNSGAKAEMGG
jgi:carboxymethylenebutenolidase